MIDQLIRFPSGKHDDAVDACSLIGRAVSDINSAVNKMAAAPKAVDRYTQHRTSLANRSNWKTA